MVTGHRSQVEGHRSHVEGQTRSSSSTARRAAVFEARVITRVNISLLFMLLLVLPAVPAQAQKMAQGTLWTRADSKSDVKITLHGDWRVRGGSMNAFSAGLTEQGEDWMREPGEWLSHRLRVDPIVKFGKKVRLVSQVDVFDGRLLGPTSDVAADYLLRPLDENNGLTSIMLRKLYLEWTASFGRLTVGHQTSQWGLGILANDGQEDGLFADNNSGDIVERALFATTPLRLFSDGDFARHFFIALGADLVFRDENADLLEGDRAWQGVMSTFYKDKSLFAGIYVAWRKQTDREEKLAEVKPDPDQPVTAYDPEAKRTTLSVWAVDVAASYVGRMGKSRLGIAGEGVLVVGETTRGVNNEGNRDGLDVLQLGCAVEGFARIPSVNLQAWLKAGYAAGDRNSTDAKAVQFKFDPGYRVGMILFEEILSATSALSAHRLSDPERVNSAPAGIRSVPTNGAITNAIYLAPSVKLEPVAALEVQLGALFAATPAGLGDLYYSQSGTGGGGAWFTPWQKKAQTSVLGYEVDGGLVWNALKKKELKLRVGAQGAVFFGASAFESAMGNDFGPVWKARLLVDLKW